MDEDTERFRKVRELIVSQPDLRDYVVLPQHQIRLLAELTDLFEEFGRTASIKNLVERVERREELGDRIRVVMANLGFRVLEGGRAEE